MLSIEELEAKLLELRKVKDFEERLNILIDYIENYTRINEPKLRNLTGMTYFDGIMVILDVLRDGNPRYILE